jgi:uncharacterized protein DUF4388
LQAKGSLAESSLRSLLESAQAERATGTLSVRTNGSHDSTTLYFLFGHLFHATGEGTYGDDAVMSALGWSAGDFDFDARAKLPADETVKSSIPELIDRAVHTANSRPASPPPQVAPPPRPAPQPMPEPMPAPQPMSQPMRQQPQPQPMRQVQPAPAPQQVASNGWTPPAPTQVASAPTVAQRTPSGRPGLAHGVKYRPTPKRGPEPIPVPQGQVIYDSLKSSFVDFPRLITTLEREVYTGYVRLLTDAASGLIFFRDGTALECVYDRGDADTIEQGSRALRSFHEDVTSGNGVLDVVSLSPELVDGLYQMTTAEPMYTDLYASWVDSRALVEFLSNRGLNGTVTVRARDGVGVMILAEGDLAGAYTSESREISDRADTVLALCDDPDAMIEVKASRGLPVERLNVDQVLGSRAPAASAPMPQAHPQPQLRPAPVMDHRVQAPQRPQQAVAGPMQQAAPPPTMAPQPHLVQAPAHIVPQQGGADWESIIADLQQATDEALGNRSRKVKDILASADRTQAGIEASIDQIPQISILFVDTTRLESLAGELRARLYSHLQ